MRDLDIKEIWKEGSLGDEFNYSQQTIDRIINQGPNNIISRFIKTLQLEKWINLIVLSSTPFYTAYEGMWLLSAVLMVLNGAFYIYYQNLIKKLDKEYVDSNVVQYLKDVHNIINRFIWHYKIIVFICLLAGMLMALYFVHQEGKVEFSQLNFFSVVDPIAMGVGLVFGSGFGYFLIHLMYGRKANKIKKMLESLDKED